MQPIRLGVIGAGLIWQRTHQPILATMRDMFTPVAFSETSAPRRDALAHEFPDAQVFEEYGRVLALPKVDIALVLTPIALNAPMATAALQAGKDVIMEKPIARSVAEGRALVALARQLGRRLYVTEQMGYRSAEDTLADTIAAGTIGDLVVWERVQHLEADPAPGEMRYENTPWRKQADFPLGTLFDGGIHLIAGLSKVFGAPASVDASGRNLRPEYGEYDQVSMQFHYANGLVGMLSHSSFLPTLANHFYIYGTDGVIQVEDNQLIIQTRGQPAQTIELKREQAYVEMWKALAAAAQQRSEPFYTAERALRDVATLEAVSQSIKSGARVAVAEVAAE